MMSFKNVIIVSDFIDIVVTPNNISDKYPIIKNESYEVIGFTDDDIDYINLNYIQKIPFEQLPKIIIRIDNNDIAEISPIYINKNVLKSRFNKISNILG